MASREHSCTRRALLAAAAAAPVAALPVPLRAAPAGVGPKAEAAWSRALALLGRAQAAMRAAEARSSGPGRPFAMQWALDEAYSDRVVTYNRAVTLLLRRPAPDRAALALKIRLAIDEQVAEFSEGNACLAMLERDVERLLPAPPPFFSTKNV